MGGFSQTASSPPHPPLSSPNLVEKQGLADIAPAAGATSSCEQGRKQAHEQQGAASGPRADEKHHEQAGGYPQQAGVPGEQAEGGAAGEQREVRTLRASPEQQATSFHSHPHLPWSESFPFLPLFQGTQAFSHRKLGADAHSRLRQDRSTAA